MKKQFSYYQIKWTSFFLTVAVLGLGLITLWLTSRQPTENSLPEKETNQSNPTSYTAGYYSNEDFSLLLENNLAELGFLSEITFKGEAEGHFSVSGVLSDPARLTAVCRELHSYDSLLQALKGETVSLQGHLGMAENGTARIIADTLTFSGHTVSAGAITPYIEQYTAVNDLFAVPFDQVHVDQKGVSFSQNAPTS